jgi:EAL domain-containing protein (putative c-di-GMP-specific phosphodiesterase class I)
LISLHSSARDLVPQDFSKALSDFVTEHKLSPEGICLEITESAIMDDPKAALEALEQLHTMRFRLSIDDFGTGYSSLSYLKRLPVQELKIDKSFVMNMADDADDAAIVRSTIDLAHNMGLKVVAEGIENQQIWDLLESWGCDYGQGYFVSRPLPSTALEEWYAEQTERV